MPLFVISFMKNIICDLLSSRDFSPPASYSGGPEFEFHPGGWVLWLLLLVIAANSSRQMLG